VFRAPDMKTDIFGFRLIQQPPQREELR